MKKSLALLLLLATPAAAQVFDTNGREKVNVETGAVTCSQGTASNLKVDLSGTGANATAVKVDGSASTQPISGTVTCNVGTGTQPISGTVTALQGSPPWSVTFPSAQSVTATNAFALDTTVAALNRAQASTTSGQTGPLVQGATSTSAPSYTNGQTNPFSLTTAGALRVDASATTQPVSGTFWQATQPVSGTFWQATQPVSGTFWPTTAGSPLSARLTDGSSFYAAPAAGQLPAALDGSGYLKVHEQGTAAVSAASLPLPTGAATLAEQQSQTTSLQLIDDAVSTTGSAVPAKGIQATGTDGTNARALKTDSAGELQVDVLTMPTVTVQDGGGSLTVDGTVSCSNCSGSGASAVDDSAFTVESDSVAPAGLLVDETSPDTVDEGHVGLARMSPAREAYSVIRDAAGNERGANVTAANALKTDGSAVTQPVSAASLPLPTGAATAANQDGIIKDGSGDTTQANVSSGRLHVDGSGVTQPVSGPLTDTELRATPVPVSGTVTVTDGSGALNVIVDSGSITANAGTNLNTSALALESGGNLATVAALSKAEDSAHSTGHTGVMALAVREATATDLSAGGTDGDYEPLQVDANGKLHVNPGTVTVTGTVTANAGSGTLAVSLASVPSHAVTNAGTFATQPAGSVAHDGVGTGVNPILLGGYASAAAPTDVSADGDATRWWVLRSGAGVVQPTFAGVLATTGNGASGTGVQRVTLANDSTGLVKIQGQNSLVPIYCDSTAKLNMTSATTTEIVAISGSTTIYVCSYAIHVGGANNVKLVRGTGTNCGTGTTDVSTTWKFGAADTGINRAGSNIVAKGAASGALCVTTSTTAAADIEVEYAQF